MNFQQLEYIIAVDQLQHFGQAAESCNITQATLSAMIKKLETELNLVLFDRSRQPVKTTEEGKRIIALSKEILSGRNQILEVGKNDTEGLAGELTIGIIPTVANSLLPMILPVLLNEYPELKLNIVEITTERIRQQLRSEKIDFGILATPLEDDLLEENILYYEAMMVYGIEDTKKKYVTPSDIYNSKVWLLEEGNCFRKQSTIICNIREKQSQPNNLKFEAGSFDTLLNLTDRFGGYTLVPELYYNLMSDEKKNRTKYFETPIPVREISMVYHRPYAKKKSITILSEKIRSLITDQLITRKYKASDLNIIGI